jgi:dTDP-4-dehydrorhamnose reductase
VVRTAWLYGAHGRNFVTTMLDLATKRDTVNVVDDQRGQPTWSRALAERLVALGHRALAGRRPAGSLPRHRLRRDHLVRAGPRGVRARGSGSDRVHPVTSAEFVRLARRPAYSVLGHDRWSAAGLPPMADWREALREAVGQLR